MRGLAALIITASLALAFGRAQAGEAQWISHSQATAPVVVQFRRTIDLVQKPATAIVDVSADNRFILYVNDRRVATGPATSDLSHWRYERVDIAPFLKAGANEVTATVWNFVKPEQDDLKIQTGPLAQQSAGTGFYIKAEDDALAGFNSGSDWQAALDPGHGAISGMAQIDTPEWLGYYVAGAPEHIDANVAISDWVPAVIAPDRALSADPLPAMTFQRVDNGRLVRGLGAFPASAQSVPPHSHIQLLIRRPAMVSAYPELAVSGGKGAVIQMTYAEALYDAAGKKGVRDEVGDRHIRGLTDSFVADGNPHTFAPLHWRTWRFLQLDITTGDAALRLDGLKTYETGYPFVATGAFLSNDAALNQIWQIGWRTARIDAHETYMDSAYWEQLQYAGDTRIQMLISYAVSGDTRLAVNAIDAFGWSNTEGGLTEGAWPSRGHNAIAPFSLLWIGQMHDWWRNQPDTAVITRNLPRARQVLAWFKPYLHGDGLLAKTPTWSFVDWVGKDRDAFPSYDGNDESCLTSLIYLGALQQAADLEHAVGDAKLGDDDAAQAAVVTAGVRSLCWDASKGLFADDPSKTLFSQHSNALAVLYDVTTPDEARAILGKITASGIDPPAGLIPASYYFSWYLVRAYEHAGLADRYLSLMHTWRDLLPLHFTTWPEDRFEVRSDSHAWSGHPTTDLLAIVAGIEPGSPGYATVRVEPHLGDLKSLHAVAMTPFGAVTVDYTVGDCGLKASIRLPAKLSGTFTWQGVDHPLSPGLNGFTL